MYANTPKDDKDRSDEPFAIAPKNTDTDTGTDARISPPNPTVPHDGLSDIDVDSYIDECGIVFTDGRTSIVAEAALWLGDCR